MSLSIETAVLGMADLYGTRIGPTLTDSYAIEANRLAVIMLTIMGNGADDAVALRVAENAQLREVLAAGAAIVSDTQLAERLRDAAGAVGSGLRISELDDESERLRRLLIALQVELEQQPEHPAALALDQRIWRLLQAIQESRAPRL